MASRAPLDARLANVARHWTRPGVAEDLARVSVLDPFSIWSLFIGGPAELARYAEGAPPLSDDRMTLEFSAPRKLHRRRSGENTAPLGALMDEGSGPAIIRDARKGAGAVEWAHRGAMLAKADVHSLAYDDYVRTLKADPADGPALDGLVRAATLTRAAPDALAWIKSLTDSRPASVEVLVARSKLLAVAGKPTDAIELVAEARGLSPTSPLALEQQAALYSDAGDVTQLKPVLEKLQEVAPRHAATLYYAAVSELLNGRVEEAVRLAKQAIAADPQYAPVYDLIGAAYTKLDQLPAAREAFEKSLSFDAHDSSAYANLGLVELAAGNRGAAANYFAEALWLEPESRVAREGLARATAR